MMARVVAVIRSSIWLTSMFQVTGSLSTSTGMAPAANDLPRRRR